VARRAAPARAIAKRTRNLYAETFGVVQTRRELPITPGYRAGVEHLRTALVYVAGVLLALCGLLLLAGAGGDNGRAATYIELGGQRVSTTVAGLLSVVLGALAIALGAITRGRRHKFSGHARQR
jgi:hypothetical protein